MQTTSTNLEATAATDQPKLALAAPAQAADADDAPRAVNSVDATTGQPIVARVLARKAELEALLAALPHGDINTRGDIGLALSTITALLTGDLDNVPPVVSVDMSRWLERSKHLGETAK